MAFTQKLDSINPYFYLPSLRFGIHSLCYLTYFLSFLFPFLPTFPLLLIPLQLICVVVVSFGFLCDIRFRIPLVMLATVCIPSVLILIWLVFDPSILFFSSDFTKLLLGYFGFVPVYLLFSLTFISIPYHFRFNYFRTLIRVQIFSVLIMSSINYAVPTNIIFTHFHNMDLSSFNSTYYGFAGRPTISSALILCLFILYVNLRDRNHKLPLFDKYLLFFLLCFFLTLKSGFSFFIVCIYLIAILLRDNTSFFILNKQKLLYFVFAFLSCSIAASTLFHAKTFGFHSSNLRYIDFLFGLKFLAFSNISTPLIFPNLINFSGFGQDFAIIYLFENLSILFASVFFLLILLNFSSYNFFVIIITLASLFHYSIILGPSLIIFLGFFLSFRWVNLRAHLKE